MLELLLSLVLVTDQKPKDATVIVAPSSVTLSAGGVQQFTAKTTGTQRLPVWSATGGTITSNGVYTAGALAGVFSVTASLPGNVRSTAKVIIAVPTPGDTTAPTVPTNLVASIITQTSFDVGWSPSSDAVGVASYNVYLNNVLADAVVGTVANFSGLACGTSYNVTVDAVDAVGNRSAKATTLTVWTVACDVPVDNIPPSIPSNLVATPAQTSIALTWDMSHNGVSGYGIYVNGALRQTVTGTSALIAGLLCNASYIVGVDAVDIAGNRSAAASLSVALTCTPPQIPSTLAFVPSVDHATNVVSYRVELRRSVDPVSAMPIAASNLGKPSADASGDIRVDVSSLVNPLPTGSYYANVVSINAGGETQSAASQVFTK